MSSPEVCLTDGGSRWNNGSQRGTCILLRVEMGTVGSNIMWTGMCLGGYPGR